MTASQEHPHGHGVAGRDEAIIRGPHRHYCSICGNDWSHESRCLEGRTAACPWCAPAAGAQTQGARTGPHFHDCPLCGKTWRHSTTCAEPFRMSLPDCPGCVDSHDAEPDSRTPEPRASGGRRAGNFRALVKACALSFLLTAGVILAFQHALKAWPLLWATPPSSRVQRPEPPRAESPPTAVRPSQPRGPAPSVAAAKRHEPTWTTPPPSGVQLPRQPRAESPPTATRPSQPRQPEPSVALSPRREPETIAPGATESRTAPSASAPASSPPAPPLPSPSVAPPSARPDVAPQPSAPSSAPPASPPEPERVVTSRAETTPLSPTVHASVAEPSVPGGPPAGVLGGASSWETLPDGHPRSTERRARLGSAPR
jgi:hypothetical protein